MGLHPRDIGGASTPSRALAWDAKKVAGHVDDLRITLAKRFELTYNEGGQGAAIASLAAREELTVRVDPTDGFVAAARVPDWPSAALAKPAYA